MTRRFYLWLLAAVFTLSCAQAQQIAVYDSSRVLPLMSQHRTAEEQLQATGSRLRQEYEQMQADFDAKYADYQLLAADPSTPAPIRERRIQEIQQADKALQAFQQQASEAISREREQLMAPVKEALNEAVAAVGRRGGYSVILDVAVTSVAYRSEATPDITDLVIAQLGL